MRNDKQKLCKPQKTKLNNSKPNKTVKVHVNQSQNKPKSNIFRTMPNCYKVINQSKPYPSMSVYSGPCLTIPSHVNIFRTMPNHTQPCQYIPDHA